MNQKPKMRKFREWAEEYFERYEDPAIKGAARTLEEYSNPGKSNYNEKRLYNYVYGLQSRILFRIRLILASDKYITKYITEYLSNTTDEFENIEINQNMIPKNYYEEILDGYFPEANLDDKELTACRRIARKHLERGDKLNDKLENAYKKLPFKNDTDQVHKIIDKLNIYSNDNIIIYDELTEM